MLQLKRKTFTVHTFSLFLCVAVRFDIWRGLPGSGDEFLRLRTHTFRGICFA